MVRHQHRTRFDGIHVNENTIENLVQKDVGRVIGITCNMTFLQISKLMFFPFGFAIDIVF
jgi:hypothetical protein